MLTVEACTEASTMAAAKAAATSWLVTILPILAVAQRQQTADDLLDATSERCNEWARQVNQNSCEQNSSVLLCHAPVEWTLARHLS
jgi:uncharacterized membrane protein